MTNLLTKINKEALSNSEKAEQTSEPQADSSIEANPEGNRASADSFRKNYITSWLSTIGPVVGINLSLDYAKFTR